VDWSKQSTSTYIVSFCLILGGSAPLLHLAPVILRRSSFRKQKWLAKEWCAKHGASQIPQAAVAKPKLSCALSRCMAALTPWRMMGRQAKKEETEEPATLARRHTLSDVHEYDDVVRGFSAPNFRVTEGESAPSALASRGSVGTLTPVSLDRHSPYSVSSDLTNMHDLEYQALGMVLKIMLGYWFCAHALGCSIFFCYFHFGSGDIQDQFRAEGLSAHWHAIYLAVSSFQNNGLVMTPSSVMNFSRSPILLNTIATLIILGNTGLPIMVRLIASALRRHAAPHSDNERALEFLLEHPRRCFTHMFPAVHTLWLLLVVLTLNAATTSVLLWQDATSEAMKGLGTSDSFFNALFQAVSARTAGLNSINIAQLSQGSTFFMCVMMYLATTPTVVTMRLSQITAGNPGELDITGRAEGIEEDVIKGDNSLKTQARRYLTQDITYLVVIMFVILVLEKPSFERSARRASPFSDGIYGDFNFFKVFFEMTSAYGTVGYSLGFQNQSASFSGVWCSASQYLLVGVMVMGRVRGLPDSIDPSVRTAMQHSEGKHNAFVSRA
jgi:Trk-type K+ transport system membrane component